MTGDRCAAQALEDAHLNLLRAQADRESKILQAQGEGQAIQTVFQAIHDGNPDQSLLAYQYLQTLPQMAKGEANKVWVVPSDFGSALQGFTKLLGAPGDDGVFRYQPSPVEENLPKPEDDSKEVADWFTTQTDPAIAQAVAKAEAEARSPVTTGITPSYSTPQYPPLSQQTQPSATDFLQQPGPPPAARPAPRHGANEG